MTRGWLLVAATIAATFACTRDDRATTEGGFPPPPPAPAAAPSPPPEAAGGGPRAPMMRDAAVDRIAHAQCERMATCGRIGREADKTYGDFSECLARVKFDVSGLWGGGVCTSYEPDKVDDCVLDIGKTACGAATMAAGKCAEGKLCGKNGG